MDSHSPYPPITATQAIFQAEILEVYQVLKELTPATLGKLMDISPRLADVSWQYHQAIELPFTVENARPAIYAYHGDVYEGLDVSSLSQEEVLRLQGSLRILSGLYGLLRPLDLIAPYRLEMGIKLAVGGQANLYDFWRKKITQALNNELEEGETLVNLASEEYFKAVDTQELARRYPQDHRTLYQACSWPDGTLYRSAPNHQSRRPQGLSLRRVSVCRGFVLRK